MFILLPTLLSLFLVVGVILPHFSASTHVFGLIIVNLRDDAQGLNSGGSNTATSTTPHAQATIASHATRLAAPARAVQSSDAYSSQSGQASNTDVNATSTSSSSMDQASSTLAVGPSPAVDTNQDMPPTDSVIVKIVSIGAILALAFGAVIYVKLRPHLAWAMSRSHHRGAASVSRPSANSTSLRQRDPPRRRATEDRVPELAPPYASTATLPAYTSYLPSWVAAIPIAHQAIPDPEIPLTELPPAYPVGGLAIVPEATAEDYSTEEDAGSDSSSDIGTSSFVFDEPEEVDVGTLSI